MAPPTHDRHNVKLSVVIPTHNPHADRLRRTLAGLKLQSLESAAWEIVVVDNASQPPLDHASFSAFTADLRLVAEPVPGLSAARRCGLRAARADVVLLVDDDNVLAPDYLAQVVRIFEKHSTLGAAGGPSRPEFEQEPAPWTREFFPLLALRDLGPTVQIDRLVRSTDGGNFLYPGCAPIGAGMALRRAAVTRWLAESPSEALSDRRGRELTSGGDNDMVLTLLHAGWQVGYFPELQLTHLIPSPRLTPEYLARLNRGIQKSWMQVLTKHGANPWPLVASWTVPLRKLKAWFTYHAWSSPAAHIRWQGACGHFEGRIRP